LIFSRKLCKVKYDQLNIICDPWTDEIKHPCTLHITVCTVQCTDRSFSNFRTRPFTTVKLLNLLRLPSLGHRARYEFLCFYSAVFLADESKFTLFCE